MAVREFDGVDDKILVDNGTITTINNSAAWSIVMLVKPTTTGAGGEGLISIGAGSDIIAIYDLAANSLGLGSASDDVDSTGSLNWSAGAWQVIAVTKPTGSVQTPRFHRKVLGSGSWSEVNGSSTWADDATSATKVTFGAFNTGTAWKDMRLAVAAVWQGTNLSDGQVQGIESTATTVGINALAPTALWDFNQASTGTNVTDLTGHGADQTAITGTTVVTVDDPAWTFGLAAAAPSTMPSTFSAIPLIRGR